MVLKFRIKKELCEKYDNRFLGKKTYRVWTVSSDLLGGCPIQRYVGLWVPMDKVFIEGYPVPIHSYKGYSWQEICHKIREKYDYHPEG